jgi:hypothetical protein
MSTRPLLALCMMFCVTLATPSPAATRPIYMTIDGHWYGPLPDGPSVWWYDGYGFYMPTTPAAGCRRDDGSSQVFGNPGLYVGQFFFPIYRIKWFSYRNLPQIPGYFLMEYRTEPGNIVCDNEIPNPIPDAIFKNGFDPASVVIPGDTIYLDGFEARTP